MQLAVITPIHFLEWLTRYGDRYHLILPHVAESSVAYINFYQTRIREGDFVILDNSAHEMGEAGSLDLQISLAKEIKCQEIVLPDRQFFGDDTLERSIEAYHRIREELPGIRIMGVPQGRTFREFLVCLEGLLELGVDTIGIPKALEGWDGGIPVLVFSTILAARRLNRDVAIHLLGIGRNFSQFFEIASNDWLSSHIRGVDSSKPIVYAAGGLVLNSNPRGSQPKYPTRQVNFFELTDIDIEAAKRNILIMKKWARGKRVSSLEM
ncbi:MAG: hypothetical protein ACTSPI_00750 [Candidatus Heimdallarchaeaceae archaeon]